MWFTESGAGVPALLYRDIARNMQVTVYQLSSIVLHS